MIPQEKAAAVTLALREAFGTTTFDDIQRITRGLSSTLKFRIVVQGSSFLLRIILRPDDPTRHFSNLITAARAGITPRVRYSSVGDRVSITDYIESIPLTAEEARIRMPVLLRTVHALTRFAPVPNHINTSCTFFLNEGPALDGFIRSFRVAGLVPEREVEDVLARLADIAAVYPRHDSDLVSSHNDLKPENTLFDGQRVWLVDWEAAFLNDRYSDLAVLADWVVDSDEHETTYLQQYFGKPADEYQRARFFLMRQVVHLFYAMGYLLLGSASNAPDATDVPDFRDLHSRMWTGAIHPADKEIRMPYARAHWKQLLENVRRTRFDEALSIVGERRSNALAAAPLPSV
jgi:hypothetical protein